VVISYHMDVICDVQVPEMNEGASAKETILNQPLVGAGVIETGRESWQFMNYISLYPNLEMLQFRRKGSQSNQVTNRPRCYRVRSFRKSGSVVIKNGACPKSRAKSKASRLALQCPNKGPIWSQLSPTVKVKSRMCDGGRRSDPGRLHRERIR